MKSSILFPFARSLSTYEYPERTRKKVACVHAIKQRAQKSRKWANSILE